MGFVFQLSYGLSRMWLRCLSEDSLAGRDSSSHNVLKILSVSQTPLSLQPAVDGAILLAEFNHSWSQTSWFAVTGVAS